MFSCRTKSHKHINALFQCQVLLQTHTTTHTPRTLSFDRVPCELRIFFFFFFSLSHISATEHDNSSAM